jgi:Gpi18-like mannosyltransferase
MLLIGIGCLILSFFPILKLISNLNYHDKATDAVIFSFFLLTHIMIFIYAFRRTHHTGLFGAIAGFVILIDLLRLYWFDFQSMDYQNALAYWYYLIDTGGRLFSIREPKSNYNALYETLIAFMTYLPVFKLYAFKLLSIIFDIGMAFFAQQIISKRTSSMGLRAIGFAAVYGLPSVIANSAIWAQCDSIYTCFVLAFIFYVMDRKKRRACAMFGIAVAFKLQAVFFAPLVFLFWGRRHLRLAQLIWIPIAYLMTQIPALIFGMPPQRILTAYMKQVNLYENVRLNIPNLYNWLPQGTLTFDFLNSFGLFLAFAIIFVLWAWLLFCKKSFDYDCWIEAALLFALISPFFLPQMHERYTYPADILAVILAVTQPRKLYLPAFLQFTTLCTYAAYLFPQYRLFVPSDDKMLPWLTLFVIIQLIAGLYGRLNEPQLTASFKSQDWSDTRDQT